MSTNPVIGGASVLGRGDAAAHQRFVEAHDILDMAEAEITRLRAIIQDLPRAEREARRLLKLLAERVVLDKIKLTAAESDDLRRWYFHEQRTR